MDFSGYVTEKMAAARLDDLRRESARVSLLHSIPRERRPIAFALGALLVRVRRWLAHGPAAAGRNAGVRVAR
ncbi:MAG TPA: hypothetical protein VJX92_10350 [Methylomirabilota bacterium]|nr:hypothetical protein [Methylomirabilota bacterium]